MAAKNHNLARRALEVAAAGGHNLMLVGNPGSGKTMLARRLHSILPELTEEERVDVTKVWSAAGLATGCEDLVRHRPFRAPHHSISKAGLVGGGSPIRPGEVSLAHRGVLFLDEMPEFSRRVLESLRQPLEEGVIVVSRARQAVRLPASCMLVGAANPCPCGWLGHDSGRCTCRPDEVQRYLGRMSGPLLDRIDLIVEVSSLSTEELMAEPSRAVRERVVQARERALHRQRSDNAHHARPDAAGRRLLGESVEAHRVIRVARTIADLGGRDTVSEAHIAEALRYRQPASWSMPATTTTLERGLS